MIFNDSLIDEFKNKNFKLNRVELVENKLLFYFNPRTNEFHCSWEFNPESEIGILIQKLKEKFDYIDLSFPDDTN